MATPIRIQISEISLEVTLPADASPASATQLGGLLVARLQALKSYAAAAEVGVRDDAPAQRWITLSNIEPMAIDAEQPLDLIIGEVRATCQAFFGGGTA